MRFFYCISLILSTSLGLAQTSITRGADFAEIYISTLTYFDQNNQYWGVLHSTDHGENFCLKYYNIQNPPGEMRIVWLVGDATPGTLYNYGGGELWFSTDFGSTWDFIEYYGSSGYYLSGSVAGIIYKIDNWTFSRSIDYGQIFEIIVDSVNMFVQENGYFDGEFWGTDYFPPTDFVLNYTQDFTKTYTTRPIDSTVATGEIPGHWPQLFRGTESGELYLVSWWNDPNGVVYKIFNSTDNGDSFTLQYASEPMNLYYGGAIFSAGNSPGSFYVEKTRLDLSTNHVHVYIDYSCDYGQTFTTYFHDLHYFFVGVDDDEIVKSKHLSIYPIPAHDRIKIIWTQQGKNENNHLKIYDMLGNEIKWMPVAESKNECMIDVSTLDPGIYIIIVISNNGEFRSEKFVVER